MPVTPPGAKPASIRTEARHVVAGVVRLLFILLLAAVLFPVFLLWL